MSNEVLQAARVLIEAKKYDEARMLLKTIDHPTATKWLAKLDEIAPPPKLQKQKQGFSPLLLAGAGAVLFVLLIFLVFVLSNRSTVTLNQTHASADGTFSFRYPDGWSVGSLTSYSNAAISNPENTLQVDIQVNSPQQIGLVANPTNPIEAVQQIVAEISLSNGVIQQPIELSLDGKPAARVLFSEPLRDGAIYLVDIGEGYYARILAETVKGELDKYLATIEAIAGSIQLQLNFRLSRDLTSAWTQTRNPGAEMVKYLEARAAADSNAIRGLSCAAWESQAAMHADAFRSMNAELQDVTCQQSGTDGDATLVTCDGHIVTNYNGEIREWTLGTYRMVQEEGEWKVCSEGQ